MSEPKEFVMDGKTFIETQMRIIEMGKIADSLDFGAFLKCIENAEKTLPMVEPEMAARAIGNLQTVKTMAQAAERVQDAYRETYQMAFAGSVVGFVQNAEKKQ